MKKLTLSVLMILGLNLVFGTSMAHDGVTKNNDHPYEVFKNTLNDFKNSKVDFYFTDTNQKQAFFESVEAIKSHLSQHHNELTSHKLIKINAVVSMISLVWEAQKIEDKENIEELLASIPENI